MDSLSLREVAARAVGRLSPKFGDREARGLTRIIFERLKGWGPVETAIHSDDVMSDYIVGKVSAVVDRLLADEPIQYIFGVARFYGMDFNVTPATLIPRPETAELVDMIVDGSGGKEDLRVLDLGTGSGCIAVALARNLRFPEVTALDVSADALAVARGNAAGAGVKIDFVEADMMTFSRPSAIWDIIVSNPPYIAWHERSSMERNVLDHEPATALFVPDDDPLKYYGAVVRIAGESLAPGGKIYLEINPLYASRLRGYLSDSGFAHVDVVKDIAGRDRFIVASCNGR